MKKSEVLQKLNGASAENPMMVVIGDDGERVIALDSFYYLFSKARIGIYSPTLDGVSVSFNKIKSITPVKGKKK